MKNIGNKAKNLLWLKENNIFVPDFVVIHPEEVITNYSKIRSAFLNKEIITLKDVIWEEVNIDKYLRFDKRVAIRTSSSLEDGEEYSFAGLYETFLNVSLNRGTFKKYIFLCVSSLFSQRVFSYIEINNLNISELTCSIIIQEMFYFDYSGVAFVYENDKDSYLVYDKGGCENVVNGANALSFKFNDIPSSFKNIDNFQALFDNLNKIYELKNCPQDIEWGIFKNGFCILQTRDITKDLSFSKDSFEIYDCTNISESYPGITFPLTYSFINHLYSKVYISFLSMFNIKNLDKHKNIFDNMLGYIDGRVYYKIENWYNFLKILPGYKYNKVFFEAMLMPKKNIKSKEEKVAKKTFLFNLSIIFKLLKKLFFYEKDHKKFLNNFNQKYEQHKKVDLVKMSSHDLFVYYENLRDEFLKEWRIPIMNDFRLMVFHGLLKNILNKKGYTQNVLNEMMSGFAKDQYFQIIREINKLALIVRETPKLREIFEQEDSLKIYNDIIRSNNCAVIDFKEKLFFYLNNFYYRRPGELKLESEEIEENPEIIINLIKNYPEEIKDNKKELGIEGFLIKLISKKVKDAIKNREIFRAKRAMVFGVAKDCFMQIAFNLKEAEIIKEEHDIFFFDTEEIRSIINRNTVEINYNYIINQRKNEVEKYKKNVLPDRIKIYGHGSKRIVLDDTMKEGEKLKGMPVSNGIVRGRALVLEEFSSNVNFKDKILVTYQTDPGWSIIFPLIKGVILERGNALSHASILSRELEIPSVVKVERAVSKIKNNQLIEINGENGEITIIKE